MNKEKQAIKKCKDFWGLVKASGLSKDDFLETPEGAKWIGKYVHDCPLCEYVENEGTPCLDCPLVIQYGKGCYELGFDPEKPCPDFNSYIEELK